MGTDAVAELRLGERERRLLLRLIAFIAVLSIVLGVTVIVVTSDPHGLVDAPPITRSDLPRLEPLYGEVNTPWSSLDWSPDGRWIAVGGGDSPYEALIIDARTGAVAYVLDPIPLQPAEGSFFRGSVRAVRWSPSGAHLAVGTSTGWGGTGWVHLYSWRGEYEAGWLALRGEVETVAWSPDGTRLLTAGYGEIAVWESSSHSRLVHATNVSANEAGDWSPDGGLLAFGSYTGIAIYDATTATQVLTIAASGGVAFSHDGARIVIAGERGCASMFRRDGTFLWQSPGGLECGISYQSLRPAWDPSDTMVALPAPGGIAVFEASTGALLRILAFPVERYGPSPYRGSRGPGASQDFGVAWSPTGESIASVGTMSAPSLRLWGVRRSNVGLLSAVFEGVVVLGLPLVLHPGPRLWFPLHHRRSLVLPSPTFGGLLFVGLFLVTLLQALQLDLVYRTYDAVAMPSIRWMFATALLSGATGAAAAVVLVIIFREAAGWSSSGQSPQRLKGTTGILGLLLLPVFWMTSGGIFVASLFQAMGTDTSVGIRGAILGGFGGLGLLVSGVSFGSALRLSVRRLIGALLAATAFSFLFGLSFTIFLAAVGGPLTILLYGPEVFVHGPRVLFGFGLAPFLVGLIALAITLGGGATALATPRWSVALFARLTREAVVDLETRRKVLAYLKLHPGAHFREMLRALGLGSGTLHYHLYVLERSGIVVPQRDGMYRRYFAAAP